MKKVIIVVSLIWSVIVFAVIAATIKEYNVTFILPNEEVENVVKYNKSIKEPNFDSDLFEITGWYTNSDLTIKYNFKKRVRSNLVLYSKVEYANAFEVYYDTFELESSKRELVKEGKIIIEPYIPTKEHFVFVGWYFDEDLTTLADLNLYKIKGDVRLYAKFNVKTYNVAFLNENNEIIKNEVVNSGDSATAPTLDERLGYTFTGWDKPFSNVSSNLEVKALYEKTNYTNHLVFNNGSFESRILNYGDVLNLSEKEPTLFGHTFIGWYTDSNLTNPFNELTMPANNLTLYAKFKTNSYTLKFNPNNGLEISEKLINFNDEITFPLSNPIKEHYTFIGWYLGDNLINENDLFDYGNNITLEAKYEKVDYNIDYFSSFVGYINTNENTYKIGENNSLEEASLLGYSFLGWYLNNNLVTNTNQLSGGNVVLEAKFEVAKFDVNFLDFDNEVLKYEVVEYGGDAIPPANPNRDGYIFISWDLSYNNVTSLLNIKPVYEKITYDITYISNEIGYYNPNLVTTYQIDDVYKFLDGELLGYSFLGWYLEGNQIFDLRNLIGDITLEARFALTTFNVTFLNHLNEPIKTEVVVGGTNATAPTLDERLGYTFTGWDKSFSNVSSNLEVKALYEKTNYTNHLVFNNGSSESRILNYGDVLNLSEKEPTLFGHSFIGWYTDSNLTNPFNELTMPANNLTLYAKFKTNSYTLKFNPNNGLEISEKLINFNDEITFPLSNPIKEHYTFIGWYLEDNLINENDLFDYGNNITLEAKYSKVNYQINYSSSLVDFNNPNIKTSYQIDEDYELLDASLSGYSFLGWYFGLVKVTNLNQVANNINLEAKFSVNTYRINYHLPSGVSNPVGQITKFTKESLDDLLVIERIGYTFAGWFTDIYLEDEFLGFNNYYSDLDLYPKFNIITYTITYNLSLEEENHPSNLTTFTVETEFEFLPASKPYHTFNYFIKDSKSYERITLGTIGNIILTPVFTNNAYTITYEALGKPLNNSLNPTFFAEEETREINAPTNVAYEFLGWYLKNNPTLEDENDLNPDPEAIYDLPVTSTENLTGNTILYAFWGDKLKFTLNYVTNYSSMHTVSLEPRIYNYEDDLYIPVLTQDPQDISDGDREKVFVGWYLDEELTMPFAQTKMGTENITIYAKWVYHYIIYYNTNSSVTIPNLIVPGGNSIVNLKPNNPTNAGYTFDGWYLSPEFVDEFIFTIMPEEDVHLYAKWNPVKYTITYITNVNLVEIADSNANNGEIAPFNALINNLNNKPKVLEGWFTNSNFTNLFDIDNEIITGNITLYAKWVEPNKAPNITIDYQNGSPDGKPVVDWYDNYNVLTILAPAKTGYTFLYFEVYDSEGESLGHPENIQILDDYTFVAIYEPNPLTITIYIDGVVLPKSIETFYGEYLDDILSLEGNQIEKEGYTIKNFYVDNNYELIFNRSVILTQDETLYANFTENTYIVTIETAPGVRFQDIYVRHNGLIVLPNGKNPLRNGYELENWTVDEQIIDIETFKVTMDLTIVAVWKKVLYQVILNDSELSENVHINYSIGDQIEKPPIKPNLPNGKIFAGWYTDIDLTTIYVHERYMEANTLTLYARYIERVDVEYYQVVDGVATLLSYDIKNSHNKLNIPTLERYGYEISCWYTNINLTNTYDFDLEVTSIPVKLYTTWIPRALELTLVVEDQDDEVFIKYYNENLNINAPTLTGHTFSHWIDSKGNIFTSTVMPNYDLELTAVFEVNNYLLQLNGNSGTIKYTSFEVDEIGANQVVKHDLESIVLSVPFGTDLESFLNDTLSDYKLVKYAYLFENWVQSGTIYEITTMPAKNLVLNASFKIHFTIGLIFEDSNEVTKIIGYNGTSKNILTPDVLYNEDGTTRAVVEITNEAFKLSKEIESIIIGNNIEVIGNSAFKGLKKLTQVVISEESNLREIGLEAFRDVTSLNTFNFPDSLVSIGNYAFYNTKITGLTMGSNLETIGDYAFYNTLVNNVTNKNSKLATIGSYAFSKTPLVNFEMPTTIRNIGMQAFSYNQLKTFILPNEIEIVGAQVLLGNTVIEEMRIPNDQRVIYYFGNRNAPGSLKEITIFDKGTHSLVDYFASGAYEILTVELASTITEIKDYAFDGLKKLNTINLDNVEYIGKYAFRNNSSLRNINLSNVISIGEYGFYYATALTNLYGEEEALNNLISIGNHALRATNINILNLPNVTTLGNYALYDLNSLTELHFSNKLATVGSYSLRANHLLVLTTPGAITLGQLFQSHSYMPVTLKTVHIAEGSEAIAYRFAYYAIYVRNYTIPSSITAIGNEAFRANYELLSIDLSETTITMIPTYAFYGTSMMRNISMPEGVTEIQSYAFYGSKLNSVFLPNTITNLGNYAFGNISTLTEVSIPASVTTIGTSVFNNSSNIRKVTIPGNKSIAHYGISKDALTTVNVSDGSETIMDEFLNKYNNVQTVIVPSSVKTIGVRAFGNMNSLQQLDLSQTTVVEIKNYTFENTLALKQVLLPNTLTSIGTQAFYNSNISNITLPFGLSTIGSSAFMNSNLEHLEIPISVNTIGSRAFESMLRLKTLIINNPTTTFNKYSNTSVTRLLINSVNLEYLQIPSNNRLTFYGVDSINNLQTLAITPGSTAIIADFANANSSAKLKSIKEVIIPDSIKVINGSAFRSLTISEIYLPNSIETIGTRVFDSSDLERITTSPYEINNELPNSLTSLGTYVFTNSKIREVVFTSGVAIDSNVFDNANLLETLIFHNDVMFPSINSNYILRNTNSLKNLTINSSVKTLANLSVPTTLPYLHLTITEGSETVIANFASGYTSLVSLVLPHSLQIINEKAFYNTKIAEVVIYENVLTIGNNAFASNTFMTDFHLTNGNVTIGTTILAGNNSLAHITVSGHKKLIEYDASMASNSSLVSINIASGSTHVIADFAKNFAGISEVNLPSSVKTIYSSAFQGSALHAINLDEVTKISDLAFANTKITELDLSNSIISIGNQAFANATNLTIVNVPASYKGGGNQMFLGANNISKLTIPSHQTLASYGITKESNLLLSTVTISEGSTIIITSFLEDFLQVRTVIIPESIEDIGANAFKGTSIEKLVVPSNVVLIQAGAFNINDLEQVEFLNLNPSSLNISSNTFNENLIKIYIPKDKLSLYEAVMPASVSEKLVERAV